jgi:hypothetical protein
MDAATKRDLALTIACKAAIGAIVLAGGFRAVSDDDFARVVHAQEFAHRPRLDPTGTSWLPFPFWLTGGAMRLFGSDLLVARAVAFASGLAAAALLYAAARLLVPDRKAALTGAVLACIFPWSARLGVAAVPELPAAALSVFAVATLVSTPHRELGTRARTGQLRVLGGAALVIATLCRYEPWLVAIPFAAYCAWDAARTRDTQLAGAALLAILGPALWLVHNAFAHDDPLHFLASVSAYKRAVDTAPPSALAILGGYPLSLLREEPELCTSAVVLALLHPIVIAPQARVVLSFTALLALLTLASIPGGAPTHHAGRALLAIWLALAIYLGAGAHQALRTRSRRLYALATFTAVLGSAVILRPWYARLDSFITRRDEIAIGAAAAHHTKPGDRILLEVLDYGRFAIEAGSGDPRRFIPDRHLDPRTTTPSSFADEPTLRARWGAARATHVVARRTPTTQFLGPPLASEGPWSLWRL